MLIEVEHLIGRDVREPRLDFDHSQMPLCLHELDNLHYTCMQVANLLVLQLEYSFLEQVKVKHVLGVALEELC